MNAPSAELVDRLREDLARRPGTVDVARTARLLREAGQVVGAAEMLRLTARLRDHVEGLGPLQDLVGPGVTDILVNADGRVWVEDDRGLRPAGRRLDADSARALAVRLATAAGRRLDDASPCADAHLPDGTRLHAVLPPITPGGTLISLRRPATTRLTLTDLERAGAFPAALGPILRAIVTARLAFLVSGGTGTGKTTLLASLLTVAGRGERIVVVEDAAELDPGHPHVVRLQARHANAEGAGRVDLSDLVRQCLRMRPDRIVVGECRGSEIRELLQALNTGHEGGCGTLHANTAADVPARLEALAALGGLDRLALASQAASALDVVIHLSRPAGVRRVDGIARLVRAGDGTLTAIEALGVEDGRLCPGPAWPELARRLDLPERLR